MAPSGGERSREAALADRLHSTAIRLLRRVRREDAAAGLTAPQLSALSVIVFAGPLRLGELAAAEQVRPPTVTRLIRQLEERGLVAREPDPADRRVARVRATVAGERVLAEGRERRVAALVRRLERLEASDLAVLEAAAGLLEGMLDERW